MSTTSGFWRRIANTGMAGGKTEGRKRLPLQGPPGRIKEMSVTVLLGS